MKAHAEESHVLHCVDLLLTENGIKDGYVSLARNGRAYQPVLRNSGKCDGKLSSLLSFSETSESVSMNYMQRTPEYLHSTARNMYK